MFYATYNNYEWMKVDAAERPIFCYSIALEAICVV